MRFNVSCAEFKKAVEKAVVVIPKAASLGIIQCIQIKAEGNTVSLFTTNTEQFMRIDMAARVIEPGECFVHKDDVKKVYGLSDMVDIEVSEGKFIVKNTKKKSAVPAKNYKKDDAITFPEMKEEQLFVEMPEQEFVETLAALSLCVSDNEANKLMTGYNMDGKKGRVTTLDGHRFSFKRMPDYFKSEQNVTVPSAIYSQLKKVVNSKSSKNVQVYADSKYLSFVGEDYQLWSRLFEGEYFKIDNMLPTSYDFSFEVNPDEIKQIGKEYYSVVKGDKLPMMLSYSKNENKIRAGLFARDYTTVDEIEDFKDEQGMSKDFTYGFNPLYIKDAMQLFSGSVSCSGNYSLSSFGSMRSPIYFDNGEYLVCVLPVNLDAESITRLNDFVKAA